MAVAELLQHPAHPDAAVRRIDAELEARGEVLRLRFRLEGAIPRLALPAPAGTRRRDGLWQHSCFEAFLRPDASDSYHEFNFAPSGAWAAYRFSGRRDGRTLPELPAPEIRFAARADDCTLSAEVHIGAVAELAGASSLAAGLAAVIESSAGGLSYWALAHGGPQPDFHDPATFRLRVTPA
jgi:hypothetical protein